MPRRKTHEEFINELYDVNDKIKILDKYVNNHTKLICECTICNHTWSTTGKILLRGHGCPKCAGNEKKTHEEFLNDLCKINKNIEILSEYQNNRTKVKCKCLIDGYEWEATPNALLSNEGCPKCGRDRIGKSKLKSHEVFEKELFAINPNITLLNKYVNSYTKIKCKCNIDGYIWETIPRTLLTGHGCPKCVSCVHRSNDEFLQELYEVNPNIDVKTHFTKVNDKITCKCKICNNVWYTTPHALFGGCGCPKCSHERIKLNSRKLHKQFISELYSINKDIEVIGTYVNSHTKLECKCKKCGNVWFPIPNNLLRNSQCPSCNNYSGENSIKNYLCDFGIEFVSQHRFNDLRGVNNGVLSYDFYLPKYNLLIEYQGEQHEKPIDFSGRGEDFAKECFKNQQEHDNRKRQYAKKNNIKLLEIWYYDFDNIRNILNTELEDESEVSE